MVGPTEMAFGAGPLYTRAVMGQVPSAAEREHARQASSTILREDSIQVEESDNTSQPDSWSMHYDCTSQAPYSPGPNDKMMTQASLLHLPKDNASHDLAFFLRTTGPTAPHRRASKIESPRRAVAGRKDALRFLKTRQKRRQGLFVTARTDLNGQLRDEGGLLASVEELSIPDGVKQKVSSTGQRYLALYVPQDVGKEDARNDEYVLSPSIVESRVSISFAEDGASGDIFENCLFGVEKENATLDDIVVTPEPHREFSNGTQTTIRRVEPDSSPIRPRASDPPTPEPDSAVSMTETYMTDFTEFDKRSFDLASALTSHPVHAATSASLPLPEIALPHEDAPVRYPTANREVDIKHPSPRRFASHPLLLQRASSIASSLYPRSVSDSPGPPPPRSPLRLRRDPRPIEGVLTKSIDRKPTPKIAPSIRDLSEYNADAPTIKPSVITDCTGPIKRPKSRGKNSVRHPAYRASRKEREERIRARKLRDRPPPATTIDAVVNAPPPTPRQRLKTARPHIQIPDLRPAAPTTRALSSASSNGSWKKITEYTRTPVSDVPSVPSEETSTTGGATTGYTPISPTASNGSGADVNMAFSPVMLVASEMPVAPSRPAKLIENGKSYAPRPRSASIARSAMKRRSRQGVQTPSTPNSPAPAVESEDTPPLPSPPPNRALPPTPPASGSEKPSKTKTSGTGENSKEPPVPAIQGTAPKAGILKRSENLPHIATQAPRRTVQRKEPSVDSNVDARLEALEKQNALLSAALTAVLRTNGALNAYTLAEASEPETPRLLAWESRIARRSAASHAASSSNGSALDLYLTTRNGSSHQQR